MLLAAALLGLVGVFPAGAFLNSQEQQLADRIIDDSRQGRPSVTLDPTLSAVARAKAADMARRGYFAHTDPDGRGANYLVIQAGYTLPGHYPTARNANNIESLAAGYATVSSVWAGWMSSPDHKRHILAESSFFAEQTALGVGFFEDSGSPYRTYWVILTAPPSGARLTIAAPAANATVISASATITGSTSGSPVADRVEVRVENAAGTGSYVAASGQTAWSVTLGDLAPGTNTFRVRSLGSSGAVLREATRVVRRIVLSNLAVAIAGDGVVTAGFPGSTSRIVGTSYTISAGPRTGAIFSHWSGGESSANPRLTFVMREGLALTAHFIPNPFLARTGAYNGLVAAEVRTQDTSGLLRLALTGTGLVTGRVFFDGASYAFSTRLDPGGNATVRLARRNLPALVVTLALDVAGDSQQITGTVSDGTASASFTADRAWPPGGSPSAFAGRYTVSLPPGEQSGTPLASGWAVVSVTSTGVATISGRLADGVLLSASATVSRAGTMPLFTPLYAALGSVAGTLRFRDTWSSDLDGTYFWHKPAQPTAPRFSAAFNVQNPLVGSRFVRPAAGQFLISLPTGLGNATFALSGGGLSPALAQTASVSTAHLIRAAAPALPGFTAAISPVNGYFRGTFTHPGERAVRRFEGVVLQKRNQGAGYFLTGSSAGRVTFSPVTR